jgi:hypothetical protein
MTRFRLQQAEALRSFDRAKVSVAHLVQSRTAKKALAAYECIPPASTLNSNRSPAEHLACQKPRSETPDL